MLPDIWNALVEVRDELEIEDPEKLSASYGILVMMSFNFRSRLRIYDPLGLLGAVVVKHKIFL
jgi:hypothetical protein